jgi:hypothetical protein
MLNRPSMAWFAETLVNPRPEKLSTRNDAIPISLNVFDQNSSRGPAPPEPCMSTTAGSRPEAPCGRRNSPAMTAALAALLSPVRNC